MWLKQVPSAEAVLAATRLSLQQAMKEMPPRHRRPHSSPRQLVAALPGRKVLVVVDDIGNILALTRVLVTQGMLVLHAERSVNGREILKANPEFDLLLMGMRTKTQA